MDKAKILERLRATFLEELAEHVQHINQELLALEKQLPVEEQSERVKEIFRAVHSLKGAARSVSIGPIESACHHLEEILGRVRDGQAAWSGELASLLFAAADALEEAGSRLKDRQELDGGRLAGLMPSLEAMVRGERPVVPTPASVAKERHSQWSAEPGLSSVRVAAERLDALLSRVGELHIARRRIEAHLDDLRALHDFAEKWQSDWQRGERLRPAARSDPRRAPAALERTGENLGRLSGALERLCRAMTGDARLFEQVAQPLEEDVRRVRMLPFGDACQGLERLVRDLTQSAGKSAELRIEGDTVELDRSVLDGLKDPLRHLVRNAIDHGIETPEARRNAGKPLNARVTVSAELRGAHVQVEVRDDGRGLDLDAIGAQARKRNLSVPADPAELARLIFRPGFSTAGIVTDISGRGVGLDVVKNCIENLHGAVDVAFEPGRGTRFILTAPLTLTTLRAVLVRAAGRVWAFAVANVERLTRIAPGDIHMVAGRPTVNVGGAPLPVAPLGPILFTGCVQDARPSMPALIVAAPTTRMVFLVEEHLAEQEILIKNLGARVRRLPLVSGATLLPTGEVALVVNAAGLVRRALHQTADWPVAARKPQAPARKRLLVVEDSMTTRALVKSILESSGYDILTAVDGASAWRLLQETAVDLIVSDVDMPNMDGFELTAAVRADKKRAELPIILVTARENDRDKARGIEVGADAYLVKSAFDQRNLLETIRQMLD